MTASYIKIPRLLVALVAALFTASVMLLSYAATPTFGADGSPIDMIRAFIDSEAGLALQGLVLVAVADFLTGVFAAVRDGTFAMDALAAWVRKHLAGRVFPIGTLLILSYFGGGSGILFLAGAATAAAAYVAETVASVFGNLVPPKASDIKDVAAAAALNPIPED